MISKTMLLCAALAASGMASATDLNQTPGFGYLHQYHNVANSDGLSIDIYIGSSGSASVFVDGDVYTGNYNGSGIPSVFTSNAGQLTLTIDETSRTVYIKQGKGQTRKTVYTLLDGTLEQ